MKEEIGMCAHDGGGASIRGAPQSSTRAAHGAGAAAAHPQALIEVEEATQRFGTRVALDRFSISIQEGTVLGILGPNGAGKTTLINLVAGLSRPVSGEIHWRGERVVSPFPRELRRKIGMVTQETALYDELTVRQNLRFAAELYAVRDRDERRFWRTVSSS